jgi:hypothetical protein
MASLLDLAQARLGGLLAPQRPSMAGLLGGRQPTGTLAGALQGYTPPQMTAMTNPQVMDYARNVAQSAQQNLQTQMSDLDKALVMDQGGINVGDRQALARLMEQVPGLMGSVASKVPTVVSKVKDFDPKFDPRVGEQERLKNLTTVIEGQRTPAQQKLSLVDFEGRPFITSMSDRTAAGGELVKINDVVLNRPVGLLGGQDYMFNNPGQVWASAQAPTKSILELAKDLKDTTGQNPLYLPWRMTPSGGDFANMTYETMLNYAESALSKTDKKALNKTIKGFIPDWKGIDSRESIQQFREAPDTVRKAVMNEMDVKFRDVGGLNIGEARLAVADPKQLNAPTLDVMNIGEIFADAPMIMQSGHPAYPRGVPGQGLGIIDQPRTVFELLPQVVKERGIADPKNFSQADRRAMEMKPYGGIINEELLKALGY